MPKCDSCICASMSGRVLDGTMILMPCTLHRQIQMSSTYIVQYILTACGVSCFVSGQPFRIIACSSFSSSATHSWNCLYHVGVTAMNLIILTMTGSISGTASGRWARLSASPMGISLPGWYVTFRSYGCSFSIIACSLTHARTHAPTHERTHAFGRKTN